MVFAQQIYKKKGGFQLKMIPVVGLSRQHGGVKVKSTQNHHGTHPEAPNEAYIGSDLLEVG